MTVIDNMILCEENESLLQSTKLHSISFIYSHNDEEFLFYKRGHCLKSSPKERTCALPCSELCLIAASEYIDCPRMPLIVRANRTCLVLIRSLIRSAGVLIVLHMSDDAASNVKIQDGKISVQPYCAVTDAEVSISQYARSVADFMECRLAVVDTVCAEREDICCTDDIDVISTILLLLLALLGRSSDGNGIRLEIITHDNSQVLRLRAALRRGIDISNTAEFTECMRIAALRNVAFDHCSSESNVVNIEFYVKDVEWSHLGIKTRQALEYDQ